MATMHQIICPNCQFRQVRTDDPGQTPGAVYCSNCGGLLPRSAPARLTTVLWIDDDRLMLSACAPVLERHGYRVLLATDGATGIATAKKERPDAILLDILMPTLTGLEVCQELRADPSLKDTPIILLTALEDLGVRSMGKKAGATATLRKPFGPEYVVEFLDTILGRPSDPPKV